jgi:hypothetical protein
MKYPCPEIMYGIKNAVAIKSARRNVESPSSFFFARV